MSDFRAPLTKPQLSAAYNITNPYNLCAKFGGPVFLDAGRREGWQVIDPTGNNTDPNPQAPWYNRGCMTFRGPPGAPANERSAKGLAEAMAWASQHYGVKAWERDVYGAYQAAGTTEKALYDFHRPAINGTPNKCRCGRRGKFVHNPNENGSHEWICSARLTTSPRHEAAP